MVLRWCVIATLAWLLAGCQNPEMRERHARRKDNLNRTIEMLREAEGEQREQNLARTMTMIEKRYDRDCQQARENTTILKKWWAEQFERWDAARPVYAQRFKELMAGDPDSMRRTLPMIMD